MTSSDFVSFYQKFLEILKAKRNMGMNTSHKKLKLRLQLFELRAQMIFL